MQKYFLALLLLICISLSPLPAQSRNWFKGGVVLPDGQVRSGELLRQGIFEMQSSIRFREPGGPEIVYGPGEIQGAFFGEYCPDQTDGRMMGEWLAPVEVPNVGLRLCRTLLLGKYSLYSYWQDLRSLSEIWLLVGPDGSVPLTEKTFRQILLNVAEGCDPPSKDRLRIARFSIGELRDLLTQLNACAGSPSSTWQRPPIAFHVGGLFRTGRQFGELGNTSYLKGGYLAREQERWPYPGAYSAYGGQLSFWPNFHLGTRLSYLREHFGGYRGLVIDGIVFDELRFRGRSSFISLDQIYRFSPQRRHSPYLLLGGSAFIGSRVETQEWRNGVLRADLQHYIRYSLIGMQGGIGWNYRLSRLLFAEAEVQAAYAPLYNDNLEEFSMRMLRFHLQAGLSVELARRRSNCAVPPGF